jgi:adenine-specific DNA-methyltransferase
MKFMGSKRTMLQNGLGCLLDTEASAALRFFDLFSGSGAVACYVARRLSIPVYAFDLQEFSAVLANAIIGRATPFSAESAWDLWFRRARTRLPQRGPPQFDRLTIGTVAEARKWCDRQARLPITKAYGGHYFSPRQAVWIDTLRSAIPADEPERTVALAALIHASSQCAAAPGHTAQPFQPTPTARRFLREAWQRDVVERTRNAMIVLAGQCALRKGRASVAEASDAARQLQEGDLAFIDPPYSGVHYSRFYHVLETIAWGECAQVSGVGRYPPPEFRPRSKYSLKSESAAVLDDLLKIVASRRARAVVTFPDHVCSNGLSGDLVCEIARTHFRLRETRVESKFSTLGGSGAQAEGSREARKMTKEIILLLRPR